MIEKFLSYNNRLSIPNRKYKYYEGISQTYHQSYGYLPFFTNYELPIYDNFLPEGKKTNGPASSIEWVVVHDTGSYGSSDTATAIANYIQSDAPVS